MAQEVVRHLINPLFESQFHDDSFGFRQGRNCHIAVEHLLEYARQRYTFVLSADIKGFFDNISHKLIENMIAAEIADGSILKLIKKFLRSVVMEDSALKPTTRGTP